MFRIQILKNTNMLRYIFILSFIIFFTSCNNTSSDKEEGQVTDAIDLSELPDMSIYHLPSNWTTQDNEEIELKDLQGKTLVVVMIYTSCQAACPRLVADMRHIERDVPDSLEDKVQYVFVSIDPEVDTPERLKDFAIENQMEEEKWLFLRGTEEDTREFAAVLAVSYKAISPIDFSHSNIISVFDKHGELKFQREGLGTNNKGVVEAIIKTTEKDASN